MATNNLMAIRAFNDYQTQLALVEARPVTLVYFPINSLERPLELTKNYFRSRRDCLEYVAAMYNHYVAQRDMGAKDEANKAHSFYSNAIRTYEWMLKGGF